MIEQLLIEEQELLNKLHKNREKQREIYTAEFLKEHGIKIGDTIEFEEGRHIVTGVVNRLEYSGTKPNYVMALTFKSDGNVGKREVRCYWSSLKTIKVIKST